MLSISFCEKIVDKSKIKPNRVFSTPNVHNFKANWSKMFLQSVFFVSLC